jgi:hypothetical protein
MNSNKLKIHPIITTGYRPIIDGSKYDKYFPSVKNNDKMVVGDRTADVDDVVELMQKVVWKYRNDTKKIAEKLKATNLEQTITNIWNFLYHHIQYKLDKPNLEELRRPARLWHDKEGDCDDFAMSASSILVNLNIPHAFRITKYGRDQYQHVYIIIPNGKGHYTIDPVLSQANYEKPFTQKKDFNMNLNGINVAVLEGFGNTDNAIIDDMFFNDLDLQGLGSLSNGQADARMYKYLVSTRAFAIKNKGSIANYDNPENFIKSLDYAIKYWHTPKRNEALSILARNEAKENQINIDRGLLSGIDDEYEDDTWDDLEGLSDELVEQYLSQEEINGLGTYNRFKRNKKKRITRRKKFWSKVKKGLKKAGKTIARYNPATAAIRGGVLIALRINMFGFKNRLKWAYATDAQLKKSKIKKSYAQKAKKTLSVIEKLFVKLGGKKTNLRKAILKGKKGQLKGIYDEQYCEEELQGLGVISSAAMLTAATTVLAFISKIFKKNKLGKEERESSTPTEPIVSQGVLIRQGMSPINNNSQRNNQNTQSAAIINSRERANKASLIAPNSKQPNKIIKLLKDNPLYAAIGGLGILGISAIGVGVFKKNKKNSLSGISGHSKKSSKKRTAGRALKTRVKPTIKIEKLK